MKLLPSKISQMRIAKRKKGFTLIITISLLVLLTMVAVGVLSLSSVTLRSSTQGNAMSIARSNAKLALMIALGDLQKSIGPDKAITATSEIISENPSKYNLTGVWSSSDRAPGATGAGVVKAELFQKWLVSDTNREQTSLLNYTTTGTFENPIELAGKNTFSDSNIPEEDRITAGLVSISSAGKKQGNFAYHVADEAVKARINSYRDPEQNETLAKKRALLVGQRPVVDVIKARDGSRLDFLPNDTNSMAYGKAVGFEERFVNINQFDLYDSSKEVGKFRKHITPYSMGLLTDVRNGGLKQDLTAMFEAAALPTEYNGKKLYQSTHGITGVSDPNWSALRSYYNIYKDITTPDGQPTYYRAATESITTTTLTPPRNFYPAPVIAKVEVLFSYVTRDSHSNWVGTLAAVSPEMKYMGHLVYAPLITLHNPYNVTVQFDKMQIVLRNIPVAFNFHVNGKPQSNGLCSINEMFVYDGANGKGEKSFALDIANWSSPTSSSTTGAITLRPGQSLVCGPYLDPAASFNDTKGTPFFDWQNNLTGVDSAGNVTLPIKARPGFAGKAVGFDVDWTTPPNVSSGQQTDNNQGVMGLKATDLIHVDYAVKQPTRGVNDRFQVSATITSRGRAMSYGGLNFVYRDASTLARFFSKTHRFPLSGAFTAMEAYHSNATAISAQGNAKALALFSAYARTTNGGVYETGSRNEVAGALNLTRDGRLAGMPMLHHNPARTVVTTDFRSEKPGMHSHELNFIPLPGHADDVFESDVEKRTNLLAGNTSGRGIKSGSYLELPTGPMQTISDFRRSNAFTSSYLPNFVQPVGNSYASPLISTDKVVETGVTSYALLDHSVLANHALYDKFYFSTIAPVGSKGASDVLTDFLNQKNPLLNQAYQSYLPIGKNTAAVVSDLIASGKPSATAYKTAAEYQMVKGAFNVNSTSVEAWKAVLSSLRGSSVPTLWARSSTVEVKNIETTPILPMSLPNGAQSNGIANSTQIDNARTLEWNGYRTLGDEQIENLAKKIVQQVRERGPFLSMSDFVNRQVSSSSNLAQTGALQKAIDESGINNSAFPLQVPVSPSHVSNATLYGFKNPGAVDGNPAAGAPGWISQADLLHAMEPLATVRSDTFVIRVCGEAVDPQGKVLARAYAEAVAQRVPEYLDSVDRPSINAYTESASEVNKAFGRRISVVSFRWLTKEEI